MTISRKLEEIGFVLVGHIAIRAKLKFIVEFDVRPEAEEWSMVIYAFRIGKQVVRIGKSEGPLRERVKRWRRDVSRGLAGEYWRGGTQPSEADEWRKWLKSNRGEFLALRIEPPDKKSLQRRESELIKDYDPPLCNDSDSARLRHARNIALPANEKIVALSTCSSAKEARRIARDLVEGRLAACVNIVTAPIESVYRWKGKLEMSKEFLLIIKTARGRFAAVERAIRKLHSYEVPEIIALPIASGSRDYLAWLSSSVANKK